MDQERLVLSKDQAVHSVISDSVPKEALDYLLPLLKERNFEPGQRIIIERDATDKTVYFIVAGQAEITTDPFSMGKPTVIAVLGPGDVAGEMAIVNDKPRSATVTAINDVRTYTLSEGDWYYLQAFYPGFTSKLQEIAQERQEANLQRGLS